MEITTTFYGIKSVEYKFSKGDILDALSHHFKIILQGRDYTFEIYEGFEDTPEGAELVVNHRATPQEPADDPAHMDKLNT